MRFKGTIIITDPCYIDNDHILWDSENFDIFSGRGLQKFGFTDYIWDTTVYGDWSCTTFELKSEAVNKSIGALSIEDMKSQLGNFCADAGLVGVFYLEEVLKFNPTFDYHIERKWTTTLIEDFDGEIEYIVFDDEVFIKGTGNINFITRQTGF